MCKPIREIEEKNKSGYSTGIEIMSVDECFEMYESACNFYKKYRDNITNRHHRDPLTMSSNLLEKKEFLLYLGQLSKHR